MRRTSTLTSLIVSVCVLIWMTGCEEKSGTNPAPAITDSSSVSSSGTMKLEGQIISVPSPTQLAYLIQRAQVPYNSSVLNALTSREKYVSEYQKAMNLGVYGADLAYVSIYEQGQLTNDYFDAVAKLAGDLQILDHIDRALVTRISNNLGNRDSLLRLNAQFFRAGDNYLKNATRSDLSGLILFGGWVEALSISADAAKSNAEIRARVGDQRHAAHSLANLLARYDEASLDPIRTEMAKLTALFDQLQVQYTYQKPIHDANEKTTYLRSKTAVTVSDEQLSAISDSIRALRNLIIQ